MSDKNSKIEIKICEPVLESDFGEALRIVDENLTAVMSLAELKNLPVGRLYLVKVDGDIAGMIKINFPGEFLSDYEEKCISLDKIKVSRNYIGCVVAIVVDAKFQKMGIGKKLIKKGLLELKKSGAKAVLTHVWMSSPGGASEKLFTSFGFLPIKIHRKIWYESSKKMGSKKYSCAICGNPCKCDALEMIKYL